MADRIAMKRYLPLLLLVAAVVAVAAIVRYLPAEVVVVERVVREQSFDTIRIIETPTGKHFRARNIELNSADSATLRSVYGIGAVFSARIVKYRNLVGGFYRKEQLREVYGITEEVYRNISANFWVDTLAIKKININFAPLKQLRSHPYISASQARMIHQTAQLKGGYTRLGQLIEDNILNPQEAQRLAPYLSFTQ